MWVETEDKMKEDVRQLVIRRESGVLLDILLMNIKGFKKSIENNQLWVVHGETERLLPYSDNSAFISLNESGSFYEAIVSDGFEQAPVNACAKLVNPVQNFDNNGDIHKNNENAQYAGTVLNKLEAVIKERHQYMPEGSYTTHLFSSGAEKIRKKTGEEAIELILAAERSEIVYESADLVYHMMVLLESEGISIVETLKELEGRE